MQYGSVWYINIIVLIYTAYLAENTFCTKALYVQKCMYVCKTEYIYIFVRPAVSRTCMVRFAIEEAIAASELTPC